MYCHCWIVFLLLIEKKTKFTHERISGSLWIILFINISYWAGCVLDVIYLIEELYRRKQLYASDLNTCSRSLCISLAGNLNLILNLKSAVFMSKYRSKWSAGILFLSLPSLTASFIPPPSSKAPAVVSVLRLYFLLCPALELGLSLRFSFCLKFKFRF